MHKNRTVFLSAVVAMLFSGCVQFNITEQNDNASLQSDNNIVATAPALPSINPTQQTSKVLSEVFKGYQVEGATLKPYSINFSKDWTYTTFRYNPQTRSDYSVTIKKNQYSVIVDVRAMGGGACKYQATQEPDGPEALFFQENIQELNTEIGELRIAKMYYQPAKGYEQFSICQKRPLGYSMPTDVGTIILQVPLNYEKSIYAEMLEIVKSIRLI